MDPEELIVDVGDSVEAVCMGDGSGLLEISKPYPPPPPPSRSLLPSPLPSYDHYNYYNIIHT